ncbi:MAG: hypothetical protein PHT79_05480 [Syntrophomonadaceae bacterium]|nr:hypothetical protein [Syntrophomonadaceae bacterium]
MNYVSNNGDFIVFSRSSIAWLVITLVINEPGKLEWDLPKTGNITRIPEIE